MANHQINKIGVPSIQRDGRAVSLVLQSDDDQDITLTIHADDLEAIIERLLDALDSVKVTKALWTAGENKELKATPTVHQAAGVGFVGGQGSDAQYIVVLTPKGEEVHIRLGLDHLHKLMSLIQDVRSIQVSPADAPPS
jgi:hypothetical protein